MNENRQFYIEKDKINAHTIKLQAEDKMLRELKTESNYFIQIYWFKLYTQ